MGFRVMAGTWGRRAGRVKMAFAPGGRAFYLSAS
jgi:hypothetical protein